MTDRISGSAFKQMITFGAACVTQQKQAINDLNVFPVPDGDTGTNMSLTIQTAVNELKKSEPATVGEAAKITAGALLRGARGNSGVILSLLFRGLSKSVKGLTDMDGADGVPSGRRPGGGGCSGKPQRRICAGAGHCRRV